MTERYVNDPRVDKVISWVLTGACAVALTVGAWFFNLLHTNMSALTDGIGDLKTEVAVLATNTRRLDRLDKEVQTLRARVLELEKERRQ